MISCINDVFSIVPYASDWKWRISWQSSCMGNKVILIDITTHPRNKYSGIFSCVRIIRWSLSKSLVLVTNSIWSQIITLLIVHINLWKSPILDNYDKGNDITISLSSFVINLNSLIFIIVIILELYIDRNSIDSGGYFSLDMVG